MRGAAVIAASLLLALALAAGGCGTSHAPRIIGGPEDNLPAGPSSGSSGGFNADDHPTFKCSDLKREDGSTCECVESELEGDPPNVYFVLDRSGSMSIDNRWFFVQGNVLATVRALGPRVNVGAAVVPAGSQQCAAGKEVLAVRRGDPASTSGRDGPTTTALAQAISIPTGGGTPIRSTIEALSPRLRSLPGNTFVVLATDGGPNCQSIACQAATCILNVESVNGCKPGGANCCLGEQAISCLDAEATEVAVRALAGAGVKTYVLGIPGSASYAPLLDKLALAGGTARPTVPYYYRVDSTGAELTTALKKIAGQILARCQFDLKTAPDPASVNVYLDDKLLPQEPGNWRLEGKTVTLTGAACDRVMAGDVLAVRVVAGCPTVLR